MQRIRRRVWITTKTPRGLRLETANTSNELEEPMSDREYVGYGSPPKRSRFKRGNLEHLKRRKKRKVDFARIAQDVLGEQIPYRDGYQLKRAPRINVHLKKLQSAALQGDLVAIIQLIDMRENSKLSALKKQIIYITENEAKY
jgi:hypothetical protein